MKKYIVISIAPGQEGYRDANVEERYMTSDFSLAVEKFENCDFYNTNELWELDFEADTIKLLKY